MTPIAPPPGEPALAHPAGRDAPIALPREKLFHNWEGARRRAERYLTALGFAGGDAAEIARDATVAAATTNSHDGAANAYADVLANARVTVQQRRPQYRDADAAGDGFPQWRVNAALADVASGLGERGDASGLRSGPPLSRRSLRANQLRGRSLTRTNPREDTPADDVAAPETAAARATRRRWERAALRRRILLGALVAVPSVVAARFMIDVLPHQGGNWRELVISIFFGALFGWISIGFWTALAGFAILASRRDRFAVTRASVETEEVASDPRGRTAIVMPICEEPVDRVFAGLRATDRSLVRTGRSSEFDIFILSDTADADRWVDEEMAWFDWCRGGGLGRVFYRRRRIRVERKSGNVAEFCRRWGVNYRYMIVLDADSVMAGDTLVRLVDMMESLPNTAVIQTVPVSVGRLSLFGRLQQFANRVYGPMFATGLHFWQLGDGQYWGHNAIIRVAPFMEHCSLPTLPGKPPMGGEILSHDFVEAALLGRAGWDLWLAYDLGGSYEESVASLLEEMKRDRRWCQGNLQHLRLVVTRGIAGAHRALFLNGILSYVSALLWFCFLALSSAEAVWQAVRQPEYFPAAHSLFPDWPVWRPDWAIALAVITAAILFLPKILSLVLITLRGESAGFGGVFRLWWSAVLEVLFSAVLAPIRMVFHTRYVLTNLFGYTVTWRSSTREDSETSWTEAVRHHGFDTVVASAWGMAVFWLNPSYFWWLTPIVVGLVLSVPISVLASRVRIGTAARASRLFLIPEETEPPVELADLADQLAGERAQPLHRTGFARAIVDPFANAIHRALLRGNRRTSASIASERRALAEKAVAHGVADLSAADKRALLYDPTTVTELHRAVWAIDDEDHAARWHR
jgi:membrane glycosyltransferase